MHTCACGVAYTLLFGCHFVRLFNVRVCQVCAHVASDTQIGEVGAMTLSAGLLLLLRTLPLAHGNTPSHERERERLYAFFLFFGLAFPYHTTAPPTTLCRHQQRLRLRHTRVAAATIFGPALHRQREGTHSTAQ